MLIKELIARLLDEMNKLEEDQEETEHATSYLISKKKFFSLVTLLYSYAQDDREANSENLGAFFQFLTIFSDEAHWTDLVMCHAPHLKINRARQLLAEMLSPIYERSVFDLLMYPLRGDHYRSSKGNFSTVKFTEFVISDKGEPIEIMKLLKDPSQASDAERGRAFHHPLIVSFYHSWQVKKAELMRKGYLGIELERQLDLDLSKNYTMNAELLAKGEFYVRASYGDAGRRRLMDNLMKEIKTMDEFLALFSYFSILEKKFELIRSVSDESMVKIMLGFSSEDANNLPKDKQLQDKAMCKLYEMFQSETLPWSDHLFLCLSETYKRVRKHQPDYQERGFLRDNWLVHYATNALPRQTMLDAADALQQYYFFEKEGSSLEKFLKKEKKETLMDALKPSYMHGKLSTLTERMEKHHLQQFQQKTAIALKQ